MIFTLLALVIATVLYGEATTAQSGCSGTLTSLSPCLDYLTGGSSSPSSNCCSQFSTVVQSSPECLCLVVNSNESSFSGFKFNRTLALNLPTACKVQTPSPNQCNGKKNLIIITVLLCTLQKYMFADPKIVDLYYGSRK